jgi:hypothetical protein
MRTAPCFLPALRAVLLLAHCARSVPLLCQATKASSVPVARYDYNSG